MPTATNDETFGSIQCMGHDRRARKFFTPGSFPNGTITRLLPKVYNFCIPSVCEYHLVFMWSASTTVTLETCNKNVHINRELTRCKFIPFDRRVEEESATCFRTARSGRVCSTFALFIFTIELTFFHKEPARYLQQGEHQKTAGDIFSALSLSFGRNYRFVLCRA